jgi:predicted nucleic acid-binding protein
LGTQKYRPRIAQWRALGGQIAISDASRLECLVGPFILGDAQILADYSSFFSNPAITVFPLTAAVCERAAALRASWNIKPLDALHLAAAIENGCGLFLTNDVQLQRCTTTIPVEILT